MKIRTAIAIAALALTTASTITPADAFGIVIRFGGFRVGGGHRHHTVRHHHSASATRVARNKSSKRGDKPVQTASTGGPMTLKTPDGSDISLQGTRGKEPIGPVVIRRPLATKETAAQITPMYYSLPEIFRQMTGAVTFSLSGTVGELRKYTQMYDAPDQMAGRAFIMQQGEFKGRCVVSLVENAHADLTDLKFTIAHEMTHCIDGRLGTSGNTEYLETFFQDVNKNTRKKVIADGFEHYIEPEEALAEAVAYFIVPDVDSPSRNRAQWDADFPNVNAKIYELLTSIKINVSYRTPKPAAPNAKDTAENIRDTACIQADQAAYKKCMGGS